MNEERRASTKAKLFLLFCFLGAIAITYWGIAFNSGSLQITSEAVPFVVEGVFDAPYTCTVSPCNLTLKPKRYSLLLSADAYAEESLIVDVTRNSTAEVTYKTLILPLLTPINSNNLADIREYTYQTDQPDGTTEIWIRNAQGDQLLTRIPTDAAIASVSYSPLHPFALVTLEDGQILEVHKQSTRKSTVTPSAEWTRFKPLGDAYIGWESTAGVFFAEYEIGGNDGTAIPVRSLSEVIGLETGDFLLLNALTDDLSPLSILNVFTGEPEPQTEISLSLFSPTTGQTRLLDRYEVDSANDAALIHALDYATNQPQILLDLSNVRYTIDNL